MRTKANALAIIAILAIHGTSIAAPTTGVYDEDSSQPNTVDLIASNSSVTIAQFKSDVANAYNQDFGGVIDGSTLGTSYTYGIDQNKMLSFNGIQIDAAVGLPSSPTPISGREAFSFSGTGTSHHYLSTKFGISNGIRGEQVVEIGLTVLSMSGVDYGNVTLSAGAGFGLPNVTAALSQPTGEGDTLLVIKAPPGESFSFFTLSYTGTLGPNDRLWFDDLAFVTAQVPEPATLLLVASGVLVLLPFARRLFQR